jgi:hypothetical protein
MTNLEDGRRLDSMGLSYPHRTLRTAKKMESMGTEKKDMLMVNGNEIKSLQKGSGVKKR